MKQFIKYVGLDVHKETIAVADGSGGEPRFFGEIANTPEALAKLLKPLTRGQATVSFCYEAGPCGYEVYRQLRSLNEHCLVVAPSLIPKKPGDRVKTDRRDALMLARLHRAGELTAVWVPDDAQEALRDLTRGRADMKSAEREAKQRLAAFLLRHGRRYDGKTPWTQAHFRFLETLKFGQPAQQIMFQEYVDAIKAATRRVSALDEQIRLAAQASPFWSLIEALMALRGVSLLNATTVAAELGELTRFANARQLMAYLGLVPSEHSSGPKQTRGGITKTGNGHARRALIEAAWTYRHPARKSAVLERRAERTSQTVQDIAWKAQQRLCGRYARLLARGKLTVQVTTAIARELAGFIWAIGQSVTPTRTV